MAPDASHNLSTLQMRASVARRSCCPPLGGPTAVWVTRVAVGVVGTGLAREHAKGAHERQTKVSAPIADEENAEALSKSFQSPNTQTERCVAGSERDQHAVARSGFGATSGWVPVASQTGTSQTKRGHKRPPVTLAFHGLAASERSPGPARQGALFRQRQRCRCPGCGRRVDWHIHRHGGRSGLALTSSLRTRAVGLSSRGPASGGRFSPC